MGFNEWWHETGSGIRPAQQSDMEAHARFVANAAWNAATMERTELMGAIARGWCTKENEETEMDCELVEAIADEVERAMPCRSAVAHGHSKQATRGLSV